MKKGYKYRLNMNYDDAIFFKNLLFSQNQTYNIIHSIKEKEYQLNKDRKSKDLQPEYLSASYIDAECTRILKQRNLTYKNNIIQQTRREYESETSKRIKKLKRGIDIGKREYKKYSHNSYQSFKATTFTIKEHPYSPCKHKILRIFGKSIPFRYSRELPSEPKTVTLSYDGLDFYISFTVEINETKITHKSSKKIGLDINNKSLDLGNKNIHKKIEIKSIKDKSLQKKLNKLQRKQSRRILKSKVTKEKVGKNYYKTQKKIKKLNKKVINRRNYRIHEMTNEIIKFILEGRFNHLIVEDLNIKEMTKKTTNENRNKLLGKAKTKSMKKNILDISYSEVLRVLEYKCVQFGIKYSKVEPRNTSKTCHKCGVINNELTLKDRIFECKACGYVGDRDHNACINITSKAESAS